MPVVDGPSPAVGQKNRFFGRLQILAWAILKNHITQSVTPTLAIAMTPSLALTLTMTTGGLKPSFWVVPGLPCPLACSKRHCGCACLVLAIRADCNGDPSRQSHFGDWRGFT